MPSREDLVAALSMGAAPQQDGRWQRLMQELLAKEEEPAPQTQQDIFVHGTPDEGTAFLESLPPGAASMRPYEPTNAEGVGNWIYDTFSGMGLPGVGDKMRQTAMEESPLAIAQGAQETTRALGEGDYGAAAMAGAGALLSAAPIPVPGAKGAVHKGIRAFRDIRPPKEDLFETADAQSAYNAVLGDADVGIDKLTGGVRLNDPAERKRVDALKAQIGGEEGYIERLIVDDSGQVIEGAHRLEALREMGARNVPAVIVRDLGRGINQDKVEAAVRAIGETRGEQSRQIVKNVLEMANDVGLDNIASQYTLPRGFETSYQAAIDAFKGMTLETAEQVKSRLAPRP